MKLLFVDESGYSSNWIQEIERQPFYVVAGICMDADCYPRACNYLRFDEATTVGYPDLPFPLGQGSEIRAKEVAKGTGWWANNEKQRNRFRQLMLSFPTNNAGVGFVVVVDKKRHLNKYTEPEDPVSLGMSYLFERVEFYCREVGSDAFCIYDHDMQRTDTLHDQSMTLIREGSRILCIFWQKNGNHPRS